MRKEICLLAIIAFFELISADVPPKYQRKEIKDMTAIEKDKYLACDLISKKKKEADKAKIDDVMKGKDKFLASGMERTLVLELLLDCVEKITDENANKLFKDLQPVTTEFDIKDFDFNFDYEPYRKKHEFIFERHLVDAMNNVKDLIRESKGEKVEPRSDKPRDMPKMPKGTGKRGKDLPPIEKDKYLACNAITITKLEEEKDKVEEVLAGKDDFLKKGLKKVMTLEMIIECTKQITNEDAQKIYKDLVSVTKKVEAKDFNFSFDYAPWKEKTEFVYEDYLVDTMNILRDLVNEYSKKRREMREKEADKNKGAEEPKARSTWAKSGEQQRQPEYKKTSDL